MHFLYEAFEVSWCYFFENRWMQLRCLNLLKPLGIQIQKKMVLLSIRCQLGSTISLWYTLYYSCEVEHLVGKFKSRGRERSKIQPNPYSTKYLLPHFIENCNDFDIDMFLISVAILIFLFLMKIVYNEYLFHWMNLSWKFCRMWRLIGINI